MSRDIVVFLGPSLPLDAARDLLDADYRPPVAQGDIAQAARESPRALALIDGYFERQPAVWHKEILWALSRGIAVYGAASMGALRAAELERFGMIGVGAVFELFRTGALHLGLADEATQQPMLTDDDEVALAHGPADSGYRAVSEAMVDIRATVARAAAEGAVDEATARRLLAVAKARLYTERRWPDIVREARSARETGSETGSEIGSEIDSDSDSASMRDAVDHFADWLDGGDGPSRRVDLKRRDAEALLHRLRDDLEAGLPRPRPAWRFQHTLAWDTLRRDTARRGAHAGTQTGTEPGTEAGTESTNELALDAARLESDAPLLQARAAWRSLADDSDIERSTQRDIEQGLDALRRRHGLDTADDIERFAAAQGVDPDRLLQLVAAEHRARRRLAARAERVDACRRDLLRLDGRWGALTARARDEADALERIGLGTDLSMDDLRLAETPSGDAGAREAALWRWFFVDHLERDEPADVDAWARARGFADHAALRRAALRARALVEAGVFEDDGGDEAPDR